MHQDHIEVIHSSPMKDILESRFHRTDSTRSSMQWIENKVTRKSNGESV